MICGTHSLNSTQSRLRESRTGDTHFPWCPFCEGVEEGVNHFTVECEAYEDSRQRMSQSLEFLYQDWRELDTDTQCCIILGGPISSVRASQGVQGHAADAACRAFIREAWELRSAQLDSLGESTTSGISESDDEEGGDLAQRSIRDYLGLAERAPLGSRRPQAGGSADSTPSVNTGRQAGNGSNGNGQEMVDTSDHTGGGRRNALIGAKRRLCDEGDGVAGKGKRRRASERIRKRKGRGGVCEVRGKRRKDERERGTLASSSTQPTLFVCPGPAKTKRSLEPEISGSKRFRPLNPRGERLPMLALRSQEP